MNTDTIPLYYLRRGQRIGLVGAFRFVGSLIIENIRLRYRIRFLERQLYAMTGGNPTGTLTNIQDAPGPTNAKLSNGGDHATPH